MATHTRIPESPRGREAWQAMVHRVANNQTRLKQLSTHAHQHWMQNEFNLNAISDMKLFCSQGD